MYIITEGSALPQSTPLSRKGGASPFISGFLSGGGGVTLSGYGAVMAHGNLITG